MQTRRHSLHLGCTSMGRYTQPSQRRRARGLLSLASMLLSDAWSTQALAAEAERDLDSRVLCGGGSQPPAPLSSPNSFSRYNPDNLSFFSLSLSSGIFLSSLSSALPSCLSSSCLSSPPSEEGEGEEVTQPPEGKCTLLCVAPAL